MKSVVLTENLRSALRSLSHLGGIKTITPFADQVLLEAGEGRLTLTALNLVLTLTRQMGAEVLEKGKIVVPIRPFLETVETLPAGRVELEAVKETLFLKGVRLTAEISALAQAEFPVLPLSSSSPWLKLEGKQIRNSLRRVVFSAATDESRPVLLGVLWRFENGRLVLASTDGFRLSEYRFKEEVKGSGSALLHRQTLLEVLKLIGSEEEVEISLSREKSLILFAGKDFLLSSSLLSGDFPDYARIIPREFIACATFSGGDFLPAVKRSAVFGERENIVSCRFLPQNGVVKLTSSSDLGSQTSEVLAQVSGVETQVVFNVRYLLEFLGNVESEELTLELSGAVSPARFREGQDENYYHLIMPIKTE